jgi:hypothetical protein
MISRKYGVRAVRQRPGSAADFGESKAVLIRPFRYQQKRIGRNGLLPDIFNF